MRFVPLVWGGEGRANGADTTVRLERYFFMGRNYTADM